MPYKNEAYTKARELRLSGWSIPKIAERLSVSKSSVSIWVRDLPQPEQYTKEHKSKRKAERLETLRSIREKRKEEKTKVRYFSGSNGRWLIPTPKDYAGTTLINGRYVYEHRYLMEEKLGRLLYPGEVVHHINGDGLDNRLENLEVYTNSTHVSIHNKAKKSRMLLLSCPTCSKEFSRERRQTHIVRKTKLNMTFCSRSCAAKFDYSDVAKVDLARNKNVIREYVEKLVR